MTSDLSTNDVTGAAIVTTRCSRWPACTFVARFSHITDLDKSVGNIEVHSYHSQHSASCPALVAGAPANVEDDNEAEEPFTKAETSPLSSIHSLPPALSDIPLSQQEDRFGATSFLPSSQTSTLALAQPLQYQASTSLQGRLSRSDPRQTPMLKLLPSLQRQSSPNERDFCCAVINAGCERCDTSDVA